MAVSCLFLTAPPPQHEAQQLTPLHSYHGHLAFLLDMHHGGVGWVGLSRDVTPWSHPSKPAIISMGMVLGAWRSVGILGELQAPLEVGNPIPGYQYENAEE